MTPDQHNALNTAIFNAMIAVIPELQLLVLCILGYIVKKVRDSDIDRKAIRQDATEAKQTAAAVSVETAVTKAMVQDNANRLYHLENGGGDQKVLNNLVGYGVLPPDTPKIPTEPIKAPPSVEPELQYTERN